MNNLLSKLLVATSWTDIFPKTPTTGTIDKNYKYYWVGDIFGPASIILYVIMGLVGAAGAIYAIYVGIQLARAEDQSKRDEAKKHLITVLIAVAVTVVLIIFFNTLLPMILSSFFEWTGPRSSGEGVETIKTVIPFIKSL